VTTNVFRIYYSSGGGANPNFELRRATLTVGKATATAKGKAARTAITCVKGKAVKKVSGVNPKCPKGYKKR
jgi:hypothetical protein